jgi:hypothetical protein
MFGCTCRTAKQQRSGLRLSGTVLSPAVSSAFLSGSGGQLDVIGIVVVLVTIATTVAPVRVERRRGRQTGLVAIVALWIVEQRGNDCQQPDDDDPGDRADGDQELRDVHVSACRGNAVENILSELSFL